MSEPLNTCRACGFVYAKGYDCTICQLHADQLERELKSWIANRYRARQPELRRIEVEW